jgi:hypothetical protein
LLPRPAGMRSAVDQQVENGHNQSAGFHCDTCPFYSRPSNGTVGNGRRVFGNDSRNHSSRRFVAADSPMGPGTHTMARPTPGQFVMRTRVVMEADSVTRVCRPGMGCSPCPSWGVRAGGNGVLDPNGFCAEVTRPAIPLIMRMERASATRSSIAKRHAFGISGDLLKLERAAAHRAARRK